MMAEDVLELLQDAEVPQANVLGHSMGGKVAMTLATAYPEVVDKLIVVDIAPKQYPPHHQQIFAGFKSVSLSEIKSRGEADQQMMKVIANAGIRQFILKNLDRDEQKGFKWKLNLAAIEAGASQVGAGLSNSAVFNGETLFVSGGNSDYIKTEDHALIYHHFANAKIETISGAGHWVHAEKPKDLLETLHQFLNAD